jgi:hypothetical protein
VYTGTYDVATLPNVSGIETELCFYVDRNNNKAIPVPKSFWKAVYDPKRQAGFVFVGITIHTFKYFLLLGSSPACV